MTLLRASADGVAGHPLPEAMLPLIGRDVEYADLVRMLTDPESRLITLTGPPGVGKTRLAVAAAHAVAGRFRDGVVFVDLAPVRDRRLAVVAVARALGLRDDPGGSATGRVSHALAEKELLLVVDNCEQVVAAGLDLAAPLRTGPGVRLLATSRERFDLGEEREVPVPPLALPGPDDAGEPQRLAVVPAVAMFVARVRGVRPGFVVTGANAGAVVEICRRLDGLPLALELAAARAKLFTPAELADRLRHRMTLLTRNSRDVPARHRTLRAALEWSHDLLDPAERAVFRRLSVFVGGWTLDAARRVCGEGGIDVLETVGSLVDKSLVRGPARHAEVGEFVLLESLREYAAELLAGHEDEEPTRSRHATHFAGSATAMEARIGLPAETEWWSGSTAAEEANLQAALDHTLRTGRVGEALSLAAALGWHSYFRGHLGTGRAHLDRAFGAAGPAPPPDDALAAALVVAGVLAWTVGELDRAPDLLQRGLAISDAAGDLRRTAVASSFLGHIARAAGRYAEAEARHEHAADLYRRMPSAPGFAWTRYDLGLLARKRGDLDTAVRHLRGGLVLFREIDYGWAIGRCAWALAAVRLRRSEVDEAAALLAEALVRHEEVGDGRGLAQCMEAVAGVAVARGLPSTAARLHGAAAGRRNRLAAPLPEEDRHDHHTVRQAVREALGPDESDRAWGVGREMTAAESAALARDAVGPPAPHRRPDPPAAASPLTARERQVAELVAAGRTNRQIGRALGIAEKTVEVHVHHVISKLGAQSRTEVAAWVVARQAWPGSVPTPTGEHGSDPGGTRPLHGSPHSPWPPPDPR